MAIQEPNEPYYDSPHQEMEIERTEHRHVGGAGYKAVIAYQWDAQTSSPQPSGGLVAGGYTSVEITAYDSNDNPTTVVFKDGAETKATLTLSYDSSGRFVSVVRA